MQAALTCGVHHCWPAPWGQVEQVERTPKLNALTPAGLLVSSLLFDQDSGQTLHGSVPTHRSSRK